MANTETFGLKLYKGDGGSPTVYTQIAGVTEIGTLFSFDRSIIDTSEIADTVKTFLAGQLDPGAVEFTVKFDPNEPTHDDSTGLINAMLTRGAASWVLEIPPSDGAGAVTEYMYFQGVVTALTPTGAQDDVVRATCSIKMSGQPVFTTTAPPTA
jgi:hypothetical protein